MVLGALMRGRMNFDGAMTHLLRAAAFVNFLDTLSIYFSLKKVSSISTNIMTR